MQQSILRSGFTIIIFLFFTSSLFSQNWTQLGNGLPKYVKSSCMMGDSLVIAYTASFYWGSDTIHVAIWNGTFFSELEPLTSPNIYDTLRVSGMVVYNGELYAAGNFSDVNGIANSRDILKWNGTHWESVGGGAGSDFYLGVRKMEVFNNEVYVFGDFTDMGGSGADYFARWDGTTWNAVPFSNVDVESVFGMKAVGSSLFLAGSFDAIDGVLAPGIAQWDGTTWSAVGGSMWPSSAGYSLGSYNNMLFLNGNFPQIGGISSPYGFAYWDGNNWHDASNGLSYINNFVSFTEFGNELWASGFFYQPFGNRYLMHWDGTSWSDEDHGDPAWDQLQHSSQYLYGTGNYYGYNGTAVWCDNGSCGIISGAVYSDDNLNCIHDNNEADLAGVIVSAGPNFTTTNNNGDYSLYASPGSYSVTHIPPLYWTPECPASNSISASAAIGIPVLDVNFADTVNTTVQDLSANMVSATGWVARIDSDMEYFLVCSNIGTVAMTGTVELHLDPNIIYQSSNPVPGSINANVYTWDFTDLNPGAVLGFIFNVHVPGNLVLNSFLRDTLIINPINNDLQPVNNTVKFKQIVVNSFDPNDKQVSPAGVGSDGEISLADSVLTYHIDFQNTGNAVAHNIIIVDTLSDAVDPLTIHFLTSSHPYSYSMRSPGMIEFNFQHVELPDSNSNEAGSHGFVEYSIHLKNNLPFGTQIKNGASIYFDFNQPVQTNTVMNTLVKDVGIPVTIQKGSLAIFPNPAGNYFTIRNGGTVSESIQIENALGEAVAAFNIPAGSTKLLETKDWTEGIYLVHSSSSGSEKIVIQR